MEAVEQKKTILILRSKGTNLSAAENFLRNREWKIFSTDNLKDALAHIVQHTPAFVMVSVDHPNKKVRSLPKILVQAFPVCVMAFAENNSAASFNLLSNAGTEYMLYPPLTGPAIERTVNKYYKDLAARQNQAASSEKWEGSNSDDKEAMISIKGSQPGMMSFKGDATAQNLFAQLMGEEGGATPNAQGAAGFVGGNSVMQPGYGSADSHSARTSSENGGAAGYVPGNGQNPGASGNGGFSGAYMPNGQNPSEQAGSQAGPNYIPSGDGSGPHGYGGANGQSPHGYGDGSGANGSPGYNPYANGSLDQDAKETEGSYRRKKDAGGGWIPMDVPPTDNKVYGGNSSGFQRTKEDSIILKGTKDALEKSVISSKHVHTEQPVQKVEQSSNVACIVVESPRFSGYLVTALGKNRKIDDQFLKGVHDRLFKFLRDNGENVKQEETMNIKIKQVPFEDWAMDCAEFLRKSVHNGDEVAMAFFPYAEAKTTLEESHHADMASVKLADLKADAEVEMNLYVYLPANQKYVLYTPRGGKLYGAQKDRLAKQGVTHMHMLKMEAEDLNKYRAQNYLNDKIEEFESRQREKKTPA